ncbi:TPA_asm: type I toxin-antitoxin system Ibs family toxin [Salmonella enterica subsp. diarizonae]|uniref:Type I toxin-antitoxin system Ibs family toxin n=1 Tax=Salmonella diarizonae TaxID=59204 RepID=A0A6Y1UI50_SALDZ|nr:type I toxin-antitoxin system Ibs family toxin [Salmonella enterica subsp. diarizonae]
MGKQERPRRSAALFIRLIIWLFREKRLALNYRCIYNYFISRTLKREEPHRSGAPHKERVMMKLIIILIVLLVISSPAY